MSDSASIKQAIQSLIPDSTEIMQGTVISESPLKIQITNDEKLILNERILVVPQHLTNYETTVDIVSGDISAELSEGGEHSHGVTGTTGETAVEIDGETDDNTAHTHDFSGTTDTAGAHTHTIEDLQADGLRVRVNNALCSGDTVYVLAVNDGKLYYILGRVGE